MSVSIRDHRDLISSLTAKERASLLRQTNFDGLMHLAIHSLMLAITTYCILVAVPGWRLIMVPHGVLLVFLFTLEHEAIHRTAFKAQWINDWMAALCGFILILPAGWFRYFHFAHHRFTNDPENDPELARPKPETLSDYLWTVTGIPVWISHIRTLIRNAAGLCNDPFVPDRGRQRVVREARIMVLAYLGLLGMSTVTGSTLLLYVWIIPVMLGQPFLRLYLMAEHGRCPQVANMLENSRTTFTSWVVRRLAWNMPYHAEHHAYPSVPFHRLPAFHEFTRRHLKVTADGYSEFHRELVDEISRKGKNR